MTTPTGNSGPAEIAAVRLPKATIQRLDHLAGYDHGGRSGLIRLAVDSGWPSTNSSPRSTETARGRNVGV
jgi:hypothetical protein